MCVFVKTLLTIRKTPHIMRPMNKDKKISRAAQTMGFVTSKRKSESSRKNIQVARQRLQDIIRAGRVALNAEAGQ